MFLSGKTLSQIITLSLNWTAVSSLEVQYFKSLTFYLVTHSTKAHFRHLVPYPNKVIITGNPTRNTKTGRSQGTCYAHKSHEIQSSY